MELSNTEKMRYARHLNLPQVGVNGQLKLKKARVLCIGAGGLGAPVLYYLAAGGIGEIGIIDGDQIELSNLQRQILFNHHELGESKAKIAKQKITALNPEINIKEYDYPITEDNVFDIIKQYDVIADCSDNFATRYLINDACFHSKKPYVYASISHFEGQLSVFCAKDGPCYRCLFESPPPAELIPNCAEGGVLGILPGVLGAMQASEIIKLILEIGRPLVGRLLLVDILTMTFKELQIRRQASCPLCAKDVAFNELDRPTLYCPQQDITKTDNHLIGSQELKSLLTQMQANEIVLLDVRELHERDIHHIGGIHIPLNDLTKRLDELNPDKKIIVYCQAGTRSKNAVKLLLANGFNDVASLAGGLNKYY